MNPHPPVTIIAIFPRTICACLSRATNNSKHIHILTFAVIFFYLQPLGRAINIPDSTDSGHDPQIHDRFTGSFPSNPIENTGINYIGNGVDLSGLGWNTNNANFQHALISSRHALQANHLSNGDSGTRFSYLGGDGNIHTYDKLILNNIRDEPTDEGIADPYIDPGDISIGTLVPRLNPSHLIKPLPILDEGYSGGTPVIVYGRGSELSLTSPRMIESTITQPNIVVGVTGEYFEIDATGYDFAVGDSQGPVMRSWTSPDGTEIYTILGNNSLNSSSRTIHNDLFNQTVIDAVQPFLVDDGLCLRWVNNPRFVWDGSSGQSFADRFNWQGSSIFNQFPNGDDYMQFDSDTNGGTSTIDLGNSNRSIAGILFAPGSNGGFSFQNGTFQIGRGGIGNYDPDDTPILNVNIELTDHQHWYAEGASGVNLTGNLDTDQLVEQETISYRLVFSGTGSHTLSGTISGTGGLTVDTTGTVILGGTAPHTYSADTWVYAGTLAAQNTSGTSTGTGTLRIWDYGNVLLNGNERLSDTAPVRINGGTLDLASFSETVDTLTVLSSGTITAGTISPSSTTLESGTIQAAIAGSGSLSKTTSGTATLTTANTFSGNTTISEGTLQLTGTASIHSSPLIDVQSGAFLDLSGISSPPYPFPSGQTLKGTGTITGSVSIAGTLSPGSSAGTLFISSGNLLLESTSVYEYEAGTTSDLIDMNGGTAHLDGTLAIIQGTGFDINNTYTLFTNLASSPTGTFSNVTGISADFTPVFEYSSGNYTVRFVTPFELFQLENFTTQEISNGDADSTADFDTDGFDTATEFAFNLDPRIADSFQIPNNASTSSGTVNFSVEFDQDTDKYDITYLVERDFNPTFNSPTILVTITGANDAVELDSAQATLEPTSPIRKVTVLDSVSLTTSTRAFYRIRATQP
ncbi:MAG: hypothetical protein AAFY98_06905 [Verrucomicrobiota bacterium]